jgi:hypothetical protein
VDEVTANSLVAALENLKAAAQLKGPGAVQSRDQALTEVTVHDTPAYIGPLLLLLEDATDDDESMFSLIHAAEAFDDQVYVRELLGILPNFRASAPRWATIVLMRALNSDATRDALVRGVRDAPVPVKLAMLWLCEKINEQGATFIRKTLPVLIAAKV